MSTPRPPKRDLPDLLDIARHVRGLERRYQGRVKLTLRNLLSHGSDESPCLDLPLRRVASLCRKYEAALGALLGSNRYRYFAGETPRTGAGPFGRYGGSRKGQSKYHPAEFGHLPTADEPRPPTHDVYDPEQVWG